MDMSTIESFLRTTAADMAVKILAAIVFWIIGRWLIGRVIKLVQAAMHRNDIDATLTRYLGSIINVALNIALVLGILGRSARRGAACSATSPPAPSCWYCARSRSVIS